ncbi:MAG: ATP-dependent zinc protease [Bacteroidetes bacterium]|nr:ATP-dependent zinc protease [Bacteroidota bacterium]
MKTIGRADKADFPELLLTNVNIKIDTGAFTSTIHSHDMKEVIIDGEKYIEFQLLDPTHPQYRDKTFKTKRYKKKSVKNSFGESEQRFVIKTIIVIFGKEYPIELSLSERSNMKYPILIGRKMLKRRFIVDTTKEDLSFKSKQKNK